MEFAEKLKTLRKERSISQQELADAIYVTRSAVAKWENGLGLPCEESMRLLCDYFSIAKEELMESSEQKNVRKNRKIFRYRLIAWIASGAALVFLVCAIVGLVFALRAQHRDVEDDITKYAPTIYIDDISARHTYSSLARYVYRNGRFVLLTETEVVPSGVELPYILPTLEYKNEYIINIVDSKNSDAEIIAVRYAYLNGDYSIYDADPDSPGVQADLHYADRFDKESGTAKINFSESECDTIVLMIDCEFRNDVIWQYSYLIYR